MKKQLHLRTTLIALALSLVSNAQINDGGFEAGIGSGNWIETSPAFSTPVCDASCGDCGGPCFARTGSFYAWFGGAPGVAETASVEQDILIPAGTSATIDLWLKLTNEGSGLATDRLEISLDGTVLTTVTALDQANYTSYTLLSTDVSTYANGASHTLLIQGIQSTPTIFNMLVDDVSLSVDGTTIGLFEHITEPDFNVFPNPANESINITFGEIDGNTTISIISIDGNLVTQQKVSNVFNKTFSFDTNTIESGTYLIQVTNGETTTTEHIVVTH